MGFRCPFTGSFDIKFSKLPCLTVSSYRNTICLILRYCSKMEHFYPDCSKMEHFCTEKPAVSCGSLLLRIAVRLFVFASLSTSEDLVKAIQRHAFMIISSKWLSCNKIHRYWNHCSHVPTPPFPFLLNTPAPRLVDRLQISPWISLSTDCNNSLNSLMKINWKFLSSFHQVSGSSARFSRENNIVGSLFFPASQPPASQPPAAGLLP